MCKGSRCWWRVLRRLQAVAFPALPERASPWLARHRTDFCVQAWRSVSVSTQRQPHFFLNASWTCSLMLL